MFFFGVPVPCLGSILTSKGTEPSKQRNEPAAFSVFIRCEFHSCSYFKDYIIQCFFTAAVSTFIHPALNNDQEFLWKYPTIFARASHLEMQSRSPDSYIHAIHSSQAFDVGDINFAKSIHWLCCSLRCGVYSRLYDISRR